ncbi:hypothetical protein CLHUN_09140 [Ruminiclostridium hungatei]|uniref:Carbohydrate-binding module family 96 domain-containing protein n=1 Tax=Ruminiclostridium hungatei TaxID=48256 RepID=A0A1V4SNS6_RUMHU|nr:DNRLRE domain-containing protein [Ruminiclostridium hungatei]OPX45539.1 hypothetical protein CLHUN_09140 [Ruminiclostridium hungatei]
MPTVTVNIPQTTFVASGAPDDNFSTFPLMFVGTDSTYLDCTGLLKINLPQLPLASVDSAILSLAVIVKNGAAPSTVIVNRITADFDTSAVTYSTQPAYVATESQYIVTTEDLYTNIQIDVTELVIDWINGTAENFGIALTTADQLSGVQFATNNIVHEPYFPSLILTYTESPILNTGTNFSYAQLAHLIRQLITFYPANVITVFTRGLAASSITGIPYELYKSSAGTFGAIFILMDSGQQEPIPLQAITAIYTGAGSVYNPSITYLTPPQQFTPGFDTDLITAYYEYLLLETAVTIYAGSNITASGAIYKNEYGLLVLSDPEGNTPIFMPVNNINLILPVFPEAAAARGKKLEISVSEAFGRA